MIDHPTCSLCLISKDTFLIIAKIRGRGLIAPLSPQVPTSLGTIVDRAKCYQTDHLASRHFGKFILLQVLFLTKLMVGSQLTTALLKIFLKLSSLSCSLDATTKNKFHLRIVKIFFSTYLSLFRLRAATDSLSTPAIFVVSTFQKQKSNAKYSLMSIRQNYNFDM